MDYETNSDDLTSSENLPNHEPIVCSFCNLSTCKIDDSFYSCNICLVKYCDSCALTNKSLCKSCTSYLSSTSSSCLNYVQSLKTKNQILLQQIDSLEKLSHQQQTLNSLASKVSDPQNNLKNLIQKQDILSMHKAALHGTFAIKKKKVEELDKKLSKKNFGSKKLKKKKNSIKNYSDVYIENQELMGKIKDLEQDHYLYPLQIIEALEIIKIKILEENCEQKKRNVEESDKEKEHLKVKEEALRKELDDINYNLQKSREKTENFEQTVAGDEQPDCRPCKCVIC